MERLYREFGRLLRRRRERAHLSQEVLGKRVGLTRTSISNLEAGRQRLPLHLVYRFADVLGIEPGELMPHPDESEDGLEGLLNDVDELRRDWVRRVIGQVAEEEAPKSERTQG